MVILTGLVLVIIFSLLIVMVTAEWRITQENDREDQGELLTRS